ncbi:MAG: glycosyltransferase [Candidatus Paceibacterota bacterium]
MSETIPKTLHYVWVGPNQMGGLQKRCTESWKKHLPSYEIKLWNEKNLPMEVVNHPYVKAMYQKGKWAFVSDYIRFWVLEREGGIYLDTDTEVLKSFDDLLEHNVFFGKTKDGVTAAGVIGAVAHHRCVQDILAVYDADTEYSNYRTSPRTITDVLSQNSYEDVVVYDYQYFNPCDDGEKCTSDKLSIAYTNNHWAESWVPHVKLRKFLRRVGIMYFLKKMFRKTT